MDKNSKILLLNLPSPPYQEIGREWAGGFGTAMFSRRNMYGQSKKTILPSFLPYASAALSEAGYEFNVVDCQRLKLNQFQIIDKIKRVSPGIIISLIGLPSLKKDLELLNKIKESIQNVLIIGVGTVCRVIPSEVLLGGNVDVILRNTHPYVSNMIELIRALQQSKDIQRVSGISYVKEKRIVSTPESPELDLGKISSPCYDFLQLDGYESFVDIEGAQYPYVPILRSKGCPYACIYCPYPVGFGRKWTYRSPEDVVDEMEYLHTVRNVKGFLLRDQSFTLNKRHATELCDEIVRRKLDLAWFCEARVNEVSRQLLEKMKKAGCKRIHYGVETGNPEILKIAKPGVNLETIRKAFRLTKEAGLWTQAHVILGWPDDNQKTIERTCKFLLDLNPDSISWNILTPYPGTKMYQLAQRDSLIVTHDWSNYTSHTIVMRNKQLDTIQLDAVIKNVIHELLKQELRKTLLHTVKRPKLFITETKNIINGIMSL
jgi:radical SAM superfamily enzyme YgiQ (UPF0313 family)